MNKLKSVLLLISIIALIALSFNVFANNSDSYLHFTETNILTDDNGQPTDVYSSGVAISGDYLAVGANRHGIGGSVYIYNTKKDNDFGNNVWEELQIIDGAQDTENGDSFGNRVDIEGDYLFVGAPLDGNNGYISSGSVYVFVRNPSDGLFHERQKLTAHDADTFHRFGQSLKVKGDFLIVGAPGAIGMDYSTGAAYIFKKNSNGDFFEYQKIFAEDGQSFDDFAGGLDFDGEKIIIGASFNDNHNLNEAGAAYVFVRTGEGDIDSRIWIEEQKIISEDPSEGDRFGRGVAISEDRIVVGGAQEGYGTGSAYVFEFTNKVWHQKAKLVPSEGSLNDWFGWKVEIFDSKDKIVVSSPHDDNFGYNDDSGSLYVYALNKEGEWEEKQHIFDSNAVSKDNLGYNIAIDDNNIIAGTLQVYYSNGKAYVFSTLSQIKEIKVIGSKQFPIVDVLSDKIYMPEDIELSNETYFRLMRKNGLWRVVDEENAANGIPGLRDNSLRDSGDLGLLKYGLQLRQGEILSDIYEYQNEIIFAADVNIDGIINDQDVAEFILNPFDMDGDGTIEGGTNGEDTNAVRSWVGYVI